MDQLLKFEVVDFSEMDRAIAQNNPTTNGCTERWSGGCCPIIIIV